MIKLNLGCGQNKLPGFVNVDKYPTYSPDVQWDLEQTPWPFETNSADEFMMNHALEHMGATAEVFFNILKEIYRIGAPGALLAINVPHPRSEGFIGDPTHVRIVTPTVMSLFSKKNNLQWKERREPNTPLAMYLDIDFEQVAVQQMLMPHWQEKFDKGEVDKAGLGYAAASYYNVINEIRMVFRVIK